MQKQLVPLKVETRCSSSALIYKSDDSQRWCRTKRHSHHSEQILSLSVAQHTLEKEDRNKTLSYGFQRDVQIFKRGRGWHMSFCFWPRTSLQRSTRVWKLTMNAILFSPHTYKDIVTSTPEEEVIIVHFWAEYEQGVQSFGKEITFKDEDDPDKLVSKTWVP